jgi:hypothetical protein
MGRKPIIREAILNVLKKSNRSLRFKEIREGVTKELNRKDNAVGDQNISYNLTKLIEAGEVEQTSVEGKNAYSLSNSFYKVKNKVLIKSLVDKANLEDFLPRLEDETNPPLTAYFENFDNLTQSVKEKKVQYFSSGLNNWSDPLDLINRRMLESYTDLEEEERRGIAGLLGHAYWYGVQSLINNFGLGPLRDVLSRNKDFAFQCIEKAEKEWKDPKRVKAEKTIIQILDIVGEILLKNNLCELFLFYGKQNLEIKKLQGQLLALNGESMAAGERIYDSFQDFHSCVLVGLEAAGFIPRSIKKEYLPKQYRYLINYSDVWDQIISSIIFQFSTKQDLQKINGNLSQTLENIKNSEKYLYPFMDLPFRSKMFVVYAWGYPEVFDVSNRDFLPLFAEWFSALKEGHLDHRSWIFNKNSVETVINTLKEVKKGRVPPDGKIDIESWSVSDLYNFHPRGKDESFWRELLVEIDARLELNYKNRELSKHIQAVLDGGY